MRLYSSSHLSTFLSYENSLLFYFPLSLRMRTGLLNFTSNYYAKGDRSSFLQRVSSPHSQGQVCSPPPTNRTNKAGLPTQQLLGKQMCHQSCAYYFSKTSTPHSDFGTYSSALHQSPQSTLHH